MLGLRCNQRRKKCQSNKSLAKHEQWGRLRGGANAHCPTPLWHSTQCDLTESDAQSRFLETLQSAGNVNVERSKRLSRTLPVCECGCVCVLGSVPWYVCASHIVEAKTLDVKRRRRRRRQLRLMPLMDGDCHRCCFCFFYSFCCCCCTPKSGIVVARQIF